MSVVDEVRHDTVSLYRFISSVCAACDQREGGRSYPPPSDSFLGYIRQLGNCTKLYLETFPSSVPSGPSYNFHRQKLWTLRSSWFELHQFVKPTADAHTLSLPAPLIEGLLRRFRQLPGFANTCFAVFHIEKLNYLQVIASGIRGIAQEIASVIPNAPPFPPDLGLIGIPYSQASSAFLNCLIPHEMGHFAYGEKSIGTALAGGIAGSLNKAFAGSSPLDPRDMALLMDWLESWAEEIFCDLFAIWLIGPCYCYAFVEIFDLANVLDSTNGLNASGATAYLEFQQMHPANLFRIKQHVTLLKKLDWWSQIDLTKSHHYKVLDLSQSVSDSKFTFSRGKFLGAQALQAFFEVLPLIEQQLYTVMSGLDPGLVEYKKLFSVVQEYFKNGIVPSTVPDPDNSARVFPSPLTVLNAAYAFNLESLNTLISGIERQDPLSIRDRQKWTEKLEAWTLKAIEDYGLLTRQERD
jgi:hypothetical protein